MFKMFVAILALFFTDFAVNGQQIKTEQDFQKVREIFSRTDREKGSVGGEPSKKPPSIVGPGKKPPVVVDPVKPIGPKVPPVVDKNHSKFLKEQGKVFGKPGKFDTDKKTTLAPMWKGVDKTHHYHHKHGHKFPHWHQMRGHFFYAGHHHHHWTYWTFSPHYGVHFYWDPWVQSYFYWCAPDNCYYPVSYVPYGTYSAGMFDPIPPPPFPGN